jgi:hypothetical protein
MSDTKEIVIQCDCSGITATGSKCCSYAINKSPYCKSHQYFTEFTKEQIELIKSNQAEKCQGCKHYHFGPKKRCNACLIVNNDFNKKRKNKVDVPVPAKLPPTKVDSNIVTPTGPAPKKVASNILIPSEPAPKKVDSNIVTPATKKVDIPIPAKLPPTKVDSNIVTPVPKKVDVPIAPVGIITVTKCKALTTNKNQCKKYTVNNTDYCNDHQHLINTTDKSMIVDNHTPVFSLVKCKAKTKTDKPCPKYTVNNTYYCRTHQPE